jgi:hypothetical protein
MNFDLCDERDREHDGLWTRMMENQILGSAYTMMVANICHMTG